MQLHAAFVCVREREGLDVNPRGTWFVFAIGNMDGPLAFGVWNRSFGAFGHRFAIDGDGAFARPWADWVDRGCGYGEGGRCDGGRL